MKAGEITGRRASGALKAVEQAVKDLKAAEAQMASARRLKHLINYRVEEAASPKGSRQQRYDYLEALIKALDGKKSHISTSAWIVTSRQTKSVLLSALTYPLDKQLDFLAVTPIADPVMFGDAKLES